MVSNSTYLYLRHESHIFNVITVHTLHKLHLLHRFPPPFVFMVSINWFVRWSREIIREVCTDDHSMTRCSRFQRLSSKHFDLASGRFVCLPFLNTWTVLVWFHLDEDTNSRVAGTLLFPCFCIPTIRPVSVLQNIHLRLHSKCAFAHAKLSPPYTY